MQDLEKSQSLITLLNIPVYGKSIQHILFFFNSDTLFDLNISNSMVYSPSQLNLTGTI